MKGSYDSSLLFHREALSISSNRYPHEATRACLGIGEILIRKALNDSAQYYFNRGLAIARQENDKVAEADIYNGLGNLNLEANNFQVSMENFVKAANLYDSLPLQEEGLSKALVNIGNLENILGRPDRAIEYTERSLEIFKKLNDSTKIAYCYKLMGRIYRQQKEYQKALAQYNEALKIYVKSGYRHQISETHHGIGSIYYDMQQYNKAMDEYLESLRIARAISDENQLAYTYTALAATLSSSKQTDRAIVYFDSALQKARQVHNRYLVMDSYLALSNLHQEQHRDTKALQFLHAYVDLKDSLTNEENRRVLTETEALYQNTKKQGEINILQKEQELRVAELRQSRIFLFGLVIVIVLLIVIGLLIFNRFRIISNARRQTEIEKMRHHIGRDLHDDIGSTLSTIHIVSRFAIDENRPENFVKHFQTIGEQSSKMLENMSDIVWSINPTNDSMENMIMRMREFCAEILEPINIDYSFHGVETLQSVALSLESRKNIFLIFKESVNNAAKYSNATAINIRFAMNGKSIRFSVEDNGTGFEENQVKAGNGLRNMRERARSIEATIDIRSIIGQGTSLELNVTP
jgi:signal transduction histidine kinase